MGIQQIKENSMLKNTALVDSHIKQHQTWNHASLRVRTGELFLAVLFSMCLKYFFLVGQGWVEMFLVGKNARNWMQSRSLSVNYLLIL